MEEKKRRSGKFNIVDIIILVILLAGVAFLGMKLLGGGGDAVGSSARVEYTVLVPDVNPQVCRNVMAIQEEKGQVQLMANGALVDGYVTAVTYGPHITHEPNADGVIVTAVEEGEDANVDMVFTIQATVDSAVTNKVGTQEVRVGKSHIVKTVDYEMEGYDDAVILTRESIG